MNCLAVLNWDVDRRRLGSGGTANWFTVLEGASEKSLGEYKSSVDDNLNDKLDFDRFQVLGITWQKSCEPFRKQWTGDRHYLSSPPRILRRPCRHCISWIATHLAFHMFSLSIFCYYLCSLSHESCQWIPWHQIHNYTGCPVQIFSYLLKQTRTSIEY